MLGAMRRHSQSFLIYVLFGAIIAVFVVSFGPGGNACQSNTNYAAMVDGERVSEDEFRRSYTDQIRYFQQMNPKGWSPQIAKQLDLKKQVMDQLVEQRLLKQAAHQAGLAVTEEELRAFILKAPAFQVAGKFDYAAYERYVNYAVGTSPARFESDLKDKLLAQKYRDSVEAGVTVSDAELLGEYLADHDKVDLYAVTFKLEDFGDVGEPAAAQIEAYQKDHGKEIEERYNRDILKYREPKKLKARHILVKVSDTAAAADVDKAKAKLEAVEKELASGGDFAALAKQHSEDSSNERGGDLGWFGPGTMVKPFEDAANQLKKGEVSKLVRSPFGFHLIKLEDVTEPKVRELKEVSGELARALLVDQRRDELLKKQAEAFLAQIKSGKSIKDLAEPEPEPAKDDHGDKPQAAKKPSGKPVYKVTGAFNRGTSAVPKIGFVEELVKDAFQLGPDKRLLDKPYKIADRYVVVELKERQVADAKKFDAERTTLRTAALGRKRGEIVRSYLKQRRETSDVRVNELLLGYDEVASKS